MPQDPRTHKTQPIGPPWQGLILDRPPWAVPPQGLVDCNNVAVQLGRLDSTGMGWRALVGLAFPAVPVRGLYQVQSPGLVNYTIIATTTDLIALNNTIGGLYITPTYTTGTATVNGTSVTGVGTAWNTSIGGGFRRNARAGDQIMFGSAVGQPNPATSGPWFTVQAVGSDTAINLTTSAGVIGGGPYTLRQCFSTTDLNNNTQFYPWSFEIFPGAAGADAGDYLMATNGNPKDCVAYLNLTTGTQHYASSLPWQVGCLRRFKNTMLYGNLMPPGGTALGTSMANSDNGLPLSNNTGVAGQYVASDGAYVISDIEVLGNTAVLYMGGSVAGDVIGAAFVGPPLNFTFTEIIRGRGPLNGKLVATFPDRHEFLGTDGQYRYNGLFIQAMNTQVFRQIMISLFDYSRVAQAHCVVDQGKGNAYWALPLVTDGGSPLKSAYVEHYQEAANNYLTKPFTKRDWPFSAATNSGVTSQLNIQGAPGIFTGDESGGTWALGGTNQAANSNGTGGTQPTASVKFGQRLVINERSRGLVKRVYPFVEQMTGGSPALNITLTMYDRVGGNSTITDTQTFDPTSAQTRFTSHYRRGRLGQVTVSGPSGWVLDGGDWDVEPGGQR